jgi:hypothetical protein
VDYMALYPRRYKSLIHWHIHKTVQLKGVCVVLTLNKCGAYSGRQTPLLFKEETQFPNK